jgi:hypothetical protein
MKLIFKSDDAVHLSLSRTNLMTLIKLLDEKVGMPTIIKRDTVQHLGLIITAEEDNTHYQGREPGPAASVLRIR